MCYICQRCKKVQGPRVPQTAVVIATRPREYQNYNGEGGIIISRGTEIVKEEKWCPDCAVETPLAMVQRVLRKAMVGSPQWIQ